MIFVHKELYPQSIFPEKKTKLITIEISKHVKNKASFDSGTYLLLWFQHQFISVFFRKSYTHS